jgi:hypothetical protein
MPAEALRTAPLAVAAMPAPAEVAILATQVPTRTDRHLHQQLRFSMAISAARCMLTYVAIPLLSPILPTVGHSPRVTIPLSVTALVFDVRAVRSVWRSELRWRWTIIAGYVVLTAGITVLLAGDFWRLSR